LAGARASGSLRRLCAVAAPPSKVTVGKSGAAHMKKALGREKKTDDLNSDTVSQGTQYTFQLSKRMVISGANRKKKPEPKGWAEFTEESAFRSQMGS